MAAAGVQVRLDEALARQHLAKHELKCQLMKLKTIHPRLKLAVLDDDLEAIFLFHNELEEIPEGFFHGLESLRSLSLYSNKLTRLSGSLLQGLESLQFVYFRSNLIKNISEGFFNGLAKLTTMCDNLFQNKGSIFFSLAVISVQIS
eukprot:TRINITY_DN3252_c0_g1_i29.p1 TRINITY_DN3252_c0_g1~~TRINITY_DN3252_c0_g1_i29.p1  ORF type:complete len:146 (-),score=27.55 TRINITY_DN3252_c0_g1_i29:957-1394(-)